MFHIHLFRLHEVGGGPRWFVGSAFELSERHLDIHRCRCGLQTFRRPR